MSVVLRPARALDAGQTGEILHLFNSGADWMPKLHSQAETIAFCGAMIDRGWVTVAERDGRVIGFLARDGIEICSLYLRPDQTGQAVGRRLLDSAKSASDTLQLWVFQANTGARRFYARERFTESGRSDGTRNDENLPDIQMIWRKETTA
ncbi:GNAT family N-acetyltransferase [Thalassovita aquimarina]|uniref:GNAT family N-acetyltransferase n=1 Tax=Thalassovita aquimarina TaxID=2785917 RepID=A0ABS5HNY0_9RHOB|nr:GNAT family N-acetyltransferase [Thalassovita aquimarina]MBR9650667.1 GNAT family N-acetyltransferase [Thalassovita aquimarina]